MTIPENFALRRQTFPPLRSVSTIEPVRQAYGDLAEKYIELFGSVAAVHADDLELIARHLSVRPGAVLDVGCGPGHLSAHLRSVGVDATGIDLVPEFVAHAKATYPNGHFNIGSMQQLECTDGSVAGILAWYSLIHVPPDILDGVLHEFRRAIEPGGTLVVGFFEGDEVEPFAHKVGTAFCWPIDELAERLRSAGFIEIERRSRPENERHGIRRHGAIVAVAD